MTNARTPHQLSRLATWAVVAALSTAVLYVVTTLYVSGQPVFGAALLGAYALALYVYTSQRAGTYRYLFPALLGMVVFVIFPMGFTIWLGFTNYSSGNILTLERATEVLLSRSYETGEKRKEATLHRDGPGYRLVLRTEGMAEDADSIFDDDSGSIFDDDDAEGPDSDSDSADADDTDGADGADGAEAEPETDDAADADGEAAAPEDTGDDAAAPAVYVTERLSLTDSTPVQVRAIPLAETEFTPGEPLSLPEIIARQAALADVSIQLPNGNVLVRTIQGLTTFAAEAPIYRANPDGTLTDTRTGELLRPNFEIGFYETPDGERVIPGFRVTVGFANYARVFTDASFREPFVRIFVWNVVFAGMTVLLTLIVGVLLAELLDWKELRFRGLYRVLLFLPYAVPGFLSILVFRGLFNESLGEINLILHGLFGIKPHWFNDPLLAKVMILIVNTWLGYPYILLLWLGLRQSVPSDLYEATALAGASPFTNFRRITWPLVRKPLTPLLVSSFGFNFNNFVLIQLLTAGRPDFLHTTVPAGTTDILVTYTYRIAFEDSGQNFGLAAAISTVIFFMVAILSLINLRLTKANRSEVR